MSHVLIFEKFVLMWQLQEKSITRTSLDLPFWSKQAEYLNGHPLLRLQHSLKRQARKVCKSYIPNFQKSSIDHFTYWMKLKRNLQLSRTKLDCQVRIGSRSRDQSSSQTEPSTATELPYGLQFRPFIQTSSPSLAKGILLVIHSYQLG